MWIKWGLIVLLVAAAFGSGLFVGWRAGSGGVDRLRAKVSRHSLDQLTHNVQTQIANRQKVLSAQLQASQRFATTVHRIDVRFQSLEGQIDDANFTPKHSPHPAHVAAGDPLATREFVRLYDAAARGGEDAAVASPGAADGVHH